MENYLHYINWDERVNWLEGKNVALYGAGKYGRNALENVKKYLPQLKVVCFLDDNKIRNNGSVEGIEVFSLSEAMEQIGDFNILITNYYVPSVLKKIEAHKFNLNRVFFWDELLIEDVERKFLETNADNLKKSYESLCDYQSKQIFRNMVESRFTKNTALLSRTCQQNQYFPEDIFCWGEVQDEVFVDVGAFDGDTIELFLKNTKQKYKNIYGFEPDRSNYEKLLMRGYDDDIMVYNAGLYDKTAEICFSADKGGSSKIEVKGEDRIQVFKFDDMKFPEDKITFVKMDIEGSELKALKGMEKAIKKHKPRLAVCIYHKLEDLWELPLYIKTLVPEYKLYIRNYTTYLDEIVLYAVV